jgi:hypothetical protein
LRAVRDLHESVKKSIFTVGSDRFRLDVVDARDGSQLIGFL